MPTTKLVTLSIPGLLDRPIETVTVAADGDNVEVLFEGPKGLAVLGGPVGAVYRLIIGIDRQLAGIVRPLPPPPNDIE